MIVREHERGGRFVAPVALRTRVTFRPLDGGETLEVTRKVRFASHTSAAWADRPGDPIREHAGFVKVDTNDDGKPDMQLPGTSNFAAGWRIDPKPGDGEGPYTKAAAIEINRVLHCCPGMCHSL